MDTHEEKITKTFIVAGVVLEKDGKYLLVQENHFDPKVYGLWNFPAGRVDEGDTIEETAVKEAKEEAGYDVELVRKLDIFQDNAKSPVKHAFEAKIIGGKLEWPKNEILDAQWFTFEEIENMKDKLRGNWVIESINIMKNHIK